MKPSIIGRVLKEDVYDDNGVLLIAKNELLNESKYLKILNRNIALSNEDIEKNEKIKTKVSNQLLVESSNQMQDVFESMKLTNKLPIIDIRNSILPNVFELSDQYQIFGLLNNLSDVDNYTYSHNIGVSALSILIGKWLKMNENELSLLSLSALLHDIGKIRIPSEILNKPGKLTEEEYEVIKKHTIYGYEILNNTIGVSQKVALVALQHHERLDGSGYPFKLKADKIDYFSKIIAVADVIHAMSSKRPYKEASSFYQIISELNDGMFNQFDPLIVLSVTKNITNMMVGSSVILSDNRVGKIIMASPHDIKKVLVQVDNEIIDLSQNQHLQFSMAI